MIVNLDNIPYNVAFDTIRWCISCNIDTEKCLELLEFCATTYKSESNPEWTIEIPDESVVLYTLWLTRYSNLEFIIS